MGQHLAHVGKLELIPVLLASGGKNRNHQRTDDENHYREKPQLLHFYPPRLK
jgi:hypothetical protein